MTLAERVEKCVEMTGVSRNAFAQKSGVVQPRIHAIIRGKTPNPTVHTLERIALKLSTIQFLASLFSVTSLNRNFPPSCIRGLRF